MYHDFCEEETRVTYEHFGICNILLFLSHLCFKKFLPPTISSKFDRLQLDPIAVSQLASWDDLLKSIKIFACRISLEIKQGFKVIPQGTVIDSMIFSFYLLLLLIFYDNFEIAFRTYVDEIQLYTSCHVCKFNYSIDFSRAINPLLLKVNISSHSIYST